MWRSRRCAKKTSSLLVGRKIDIGRTTDFPVILSIPCEFLKSKVGPNILPIGVVTPLWKSGNGFSEMKIEGKEEPIG